MRIQWLKIDVSLKQMTCMGMALVTRKPRWWTRVSGRSKYVIIQKRAA